MMYLVIQWRGGDPQWECQGIFSTPEKAAEACRAPGYCYAKFEVDRFAVDEEQSKMWAAEAAELDSKIGVERLRVERGSDVDRARRLVESWDRQLSSLQTEPLGELVAAWEAYSSATEPSDERGLLGALGAAVTNLAAEWSESLEKTTALRNEAMADVRRLEKLDFQTEPSKLDELGELPEATMADSRWIYPEGGGPEE